MQTRILASLVLGCALVGAAAADTVVVNDQVQVRESSISLPKRGLTMDEVEKHFGAPLNRHPAVGGASAQQPPIIRWDYSGFAVIFERDRVIDAVATSGEPPSSPSSPAVASTG
jgi:hypothetical protein